MWCRPPPHTHPLTPNPQPPSPPPNPTPQLPPTDPCADCAERFRALADRGLRRCSRSWASRRRRSRCRAPRSETQPRVALASRRLRAEGLGYETNGDIYIYIHGKTGGWIEQKGEEYEPKPIWQVQTKRPRKSSNRSSGGSSFPPRFRRHTSFSLTLLLVFLGLHDVFVHEVITRFLSSWTLITFWLWTF